MAAPATNYAVGNNIYNGGSSAATMGTVDPTGYIDRSLNNQSRSGIAQAALSRLRALGGGYQGNPPIAGPLDPGDPFGGPVTGPPPLINGTGLVDHTINTTPPPYLNGGNPPMGNGGLPLAAAPQGGQQISQSVAGNNSPAAQSLAQQAQGANSIPLPTITPLNVNALGQITAPANTLPLDADLAAQEAAQTAAANNTLTQYQQQQQQLGSQYATSAHTAVEQIPQILSSLLSNFASGRGMGFSSGYGQAFNNDENSFQKQMDALYNTAQSGITGVETNAALVPTTLSSAIQQILATQAARNNSAIQAGGTLGLGTPGQVAGFNPLTHQQSVVVDNPIDLQQAIKAGYSPSQIFTLPTYQGPSLGVGVLPTGAQNVIFAGRAGSQAGSYPGAQAAQGSDRNATEKLLEQLRAMAGA